MNIGVLSVHDVSNDGVERGFAEVMAVNAAADMTEGVEGCGMGDSDAIPLARPKPRPSRLRQGGLVMRDQVAGCLVQSGDDLPLPVAQQDPCVRHKSFRPADLTLLVHEHNRLILRIETEASNANPV